MRILAIDPGNVTGIAGYDTESGEPPYTEEIDDGLYGFVAWLPLELTCYWPDLILCEDFIIRPDTHKKTREPAAYELIGYIKGKCYEKGIPVDMIGPSEHKPFTEFEKKRKSKIARLGWSRPSKDMHADAAMSVLLLGLTRHAHEHATTLLKEIAQ